MIGNREDLRTYLAADLQANGLRGWRWHYRYVYRPAHYQRLLRRCEYWLNTSRTPVGRLVAVWFKVRTNVLRWRFGFYIWPNVFGPGLSIVHAGPVWVHAEARVGANCRLYQGITIGEAHGKVPVIGDDVWIYPLAMVLGADVGNRAAVLAGAVVTDSVPEDVQVAGVPARIVRTLEPVRRTA